MPQVEDGTTNLEANSVRIGFPACDRASLDPNVGVCEELDLGAKNKLFPKGELCLLTCASAPVKLSKLMVVFMPATPAEGFLMVPGAAPLKYLAPVRGP